MSIDCRFARSRAFATAPLYRAGLCILVVGSLLQACEASSSLEGEPGTDVDQESGIDGLDSPDASTDALTDSDVTDVETDATADSDTDADADAGSGPDAPDADADSGVEPGAIGAPCDSGPDCDSGVCVTTLGDVDAGICSAACVDAAGCPDGYACVTLVESGSDAVQRCVPSTLCLDSDGDGFGVGPGCRGPDCDDTDDGINPAADEVCDLRDQDCDERVDDNPIDARQPCGTGLGGTCETGSTVCTNGFITCQSVIEDCSTTTNRAPSAPEVAVSPLRPVTGDALVASLVVPSLDPDGDAVSYSYQWLRDGAPVEDIALPEVPAGTVRRGEVWEVVVVASDGALTSPSGRDDVLVGNALPTLSSLSISPASPTTDTALSAVSGTPSDLDDDPVVIGYAWSVDGVAAGTATTLPSSRFVRGQRVTLTAVPYDGFDLGAPMEATAVVVGNSAPVVTAVTITPSVATTDTVLTANVTRSDADDDALSLGYAWFVDGFPVAGLPVGSSTLDGRGYFDRGQSVTVRVVANDGTDVSAPVMSAPVVIANSAPSAATAQIEPSAPLAGESLRCVIDVAPLDADGDALTVTVEWTVDGVPAAETTTTTVTDDTVDGAQVQAGEQWSCVVVATDGELTSRSLEARVTALLCSPADPAECVSGDLRRCSADGQSYDTIECGVAGCEIGACVTPICVPETPRCAANTLYVCSADGRSETATLCGADAVCDAAMASCVPYLCSVGQRRCTLDQLEQCRADRTGYELVEDCGLTVVDGVSQICDPASLECVFGIDAPCVGYDAVTGAPLPYDCVGTAPVCVGADPVEGSFVCNDAGFVCTPADVDTCVGDMAVGLCQEGQPFGWDCASLGGDCATGTCVNLGEGAVCGPVTFGELHCAGGLVCLSGVCAPASTLGDECSADAQCPSDARCSTVAGYRRCVPVALADTASPIRFVYVPGGTFSMGSTVRTNEPPIHDVTLSAYFVAETEVTQGQWTAIATSNPSFFNRGTTPNCTSPTCPVERVSWYASVAYANALSAREGLSSCYTLTPSTCADELSDWSGGAASSCTGTTYVGRGCTGYRLLTEAEWERAVRGGQGTTSSTATTYSWGNASDTATVGTYAWFLGNSGGTTRPVGTKTANAYGLYDMSGNVWELVWDWSGEQYSGFTLSPDPVGASSGFGRVSRGGGWNTVASNLRSAFRNGGNPDDQSEVIGFRLARSVPRQNLELGELCDADVQCLSGYCADTTVDPEYHRCAPVALADTASPIEFVYVPGGTFSMGSTVSSNEQPVHDVTLSAYFVAQTEVTQGQWQAAAGANPSFFNRGTTPNCTSPTCPVEQMSWYASAAYANALSAREGLSSCYTLTPSTCADELSDWSGGAASSCTGTTYVGRGCTGYRLLTEAEWERAARGGQGTTSSTATAYHWGNATDLATVGIYAWYDGNSGSTTRAVGTKAANAYGLHDMSGNVWEWVWDLYGASYSGFTLSPDPVGASSGSSRVSRGGGLASVASGLRSAQRSSHTPDYLNNNIGFRLARSVP